MKFVFEDFDLAPADFCGYNEDHLGLCFSKYMFINSFCKVCWCKTLNTQLVPYLELNQRNPSPAVEEAYKRGDVPCF